MARRMNRSRGFGATPKQHDDEFKIAARRANISISQAERAVSIRDCGTAYGFLMDAARYEAAAEADAFYSKDKSRPAQFKELELAFGEVRDEFAKACVVKRRR